MTPTYEELNRVLDQAEIAMDQFPRIEVRTEHAVAFGFYIRRVILPAPSVIATKVHGVRSPFVVSRGKCIVKSADGLESIIIGPHTGITEPGTRRIIYVMEETEWTTFQPIADASMHQLIDDFERQVMIPTEHHVEIADSLNRQPTERITNDAH